MRFSLSGHDLIRLATAVERFDIPPLSREASARIVPDDGSVVAKGRNAMPAGPGVSGRGSHGHSRRVRRG